MGILETLRKSIEKVGVKEVARRSGLSPSTVSRVGSGQIVPGLEVAEKISRATGYRIDLLPLITDGGNKSKLENVLHVLRTLRPDLIKRGVRHIVVFGSVARQEDRADSDIDLYVDYGQSSPGAIKVLGAEAIILEAFPDTKVDFVTNLSSQKGQRLKIEIEKDGMRAF